MIGKDWNAEQANTSMTTEDIAACGKARDSSPYKISRILEFAVTWDDVEAAFANGFAFGCAWTHANVSETLHNWLQEFGRE